MKGAILVFALGLLGGDALAQSAVRVVNGVPVIMSPAQEADFRKSLENAPVPVAPKPIDNRIKNIEDAVRGLGGNLPARANGAVARP